MSNLHPVFAQILATMAPAPKTPPTPSGYDEFVIDSDVGELVVWMAVEKPVVIHLGPVDITTHIPPWALRRLVAKADELAARERAERNEALAIERRYG